MKLLSGVRLFATPRTVARESLLSMEFSRQEYWSWLPFPPPGTVPDPGVKPASADSPALVCSLPLSHLGNPHLQIALVIKWQRPIQGSSKKKMIMTETMDLINMLKNISLDKGKLKYYKSKKAM